MKHPLGSHFLVVLQLAALLGCVYPVNLTNLGSVNALALCLLGATLGLTALYYNKIGNFSVYPEIRDGAKLITTGPYKFVRHPMYLALFIMMTGISIYNGHAINFVSLSIIVPVLVRKALIEEYYLADRFPDYDSYKTTTRRFIPW